MSNVLQIEVEDGILAAHVERPAGSARAAVVVLSEARGVNDDVRATCGRLASHGFLALAPDLFWRHARDLSQPNPGDLLQPHFDHDRGLKDVEAAVTYARHIGGPLGSVGIVGFCLGGLIGFRAAIAGIGDAAVCCCGSEIEPSLCEAAAIDMPLMLHLARLDAAMLPAASQAIAASFAGRPQTEVYMYDGCTPAFTRQGGAQHVACAALLAHERTLRFMLQHLC